MSSENNKFNIFTNRVLPLAMCGAFITGAGFLTKNKIGELVDNKNSTGFDTQNVKLDNTKPYEIEESYLPTAESGNDKKEISQYQIFEIPLKYKVRIAKSKNSPNGKIEEWELFPISNKKNHYIQKSDGREFNLTENADETMTIGNVVAENQTVNKFLLNQKPKVYKVKFKDGSSANWELYIVTGKQNRYLRKSDGREFAMSQNPDGTLKLVNSNSKLSPNKYATIKIKPESGSFIIPANNPNLDLAIKNNAKHGLETLAVIGTGAMIKESQLSNSSTVKPNSSKVPAGDVFNRFSNGQILATRYWQKNKEKSMRDAGFYTTKDGNLHLLNLHGLKNNTEKAAVLKKLESLKDPIGKNVIAYSLTGWTINPGEKNVITAKTEARLAYVFSKLNGSFKGVLITPSIDYSTFELTVQNQFGKDSISVLFDDGLNAGILDLRRNTLQNRAIASKTRKATDNLPNSSITHKEEMYNTNAALLLVRRAKHPRLNLLTKPVKPKTPEINSPQKNGKTDSFADLKKVIANPKEIQKALNALFIESQRLLPQPKNYSNKKGK